MITGEGVKALRSREHGSLATLSEGFAYSNAEGYVIEDTAIDEKVCQ